MWLKNICGERRKGKELWSGWRGYVRNKVVRYRTARTTRSLVYSFVRSYVAWQWKRQDVKMWNVFSQRVASSYGGSFRARREECAKKSVNDNFWLSDEWLQIRTEICINVGRNKIKCWKSFARSNLQADNPKLDWNFISISKDEAEPLFECHFMRSLKLHT